MPGGGRGQASFGGVPGVGLRWKIQRMRYALGEARRNRDRKFLRTTTAISLIRDMRKSRLMIRFVAVNRKLQVRRGLLGITRNFGHTAKAITKATGHIMRRAATVCAHTKYSVVDKAIHYYYIIILNTMNYAQ